MSRATPLALLHPMATPLNAHVGGNQLVAGQALALAAHFWPHFRCISLHFAACPESGGDSRQALPLLRQHVAAVTGRPLGAHAALRDERP